LGRENIETLPLPVLASLEFGWQVIGYARPDLSRPSSDNEPHWNVRWSPCEVSSLFTRKVFARRDSPALSFTRRFAMDKQIPEYLFRLGRPD
jgi:hypothetical protein